jgi:hypothetical protein
VAPPAPDVLAGPVGVVSGIEFSLDRASIEDVVAGVAGGRAKRRRLARALLQRPAILTDGRSPAPRVAGNLLIALRQVGAVMLKPARTTTSSVTSATMSTSSAITSRPSPGSATRSP